MTNTDPIHIRQMLLDAGVRPSVHRAAVLDYVLCHRTHPTAEEIFASLSATSPSLSRTTVYNSLKALADAGLVTTIEATPDGSTHYDSTGCKPHSHFVCRQCGAIIDIDHIPPRPESFDGMSVESAATVYRGLCNACCG